MAAAVFSAALMASAGSVRGEPFVYVSGEAGVSVIDAAADAVVDTYPVGPTAALAITRDGRWLYAGRAPEDGAFEIVTLDAMTGELAAPYALPGPVRYITLSADESRLWVSHVRCQKAGECTGSAGVTVFDVASHSVEATLGDIGGPVALDPSGQLAYGLGFHGIVAIDTATFAVIAERPVICCVAGGLELHPNGHTVYALGNEFGGFIAIADLRRPLDLATAWFVRGQAMTHLDYQWDVAFHPDGTRAYLPGRIGPVATLFVVDTSDPWVPSLERTIDLAARPLRIALTRDGRRAYLLNDNRSVTVVELDSGDVITTIAVPSEAGQIVVGPGDAPTSPHPAGAESGGGCHITSSQGNSGAPALLSLLAFAVVAVRAMIHHQDAKHTTRR